MVAVVVRSMDRAIMIRRMEGMYMVLDSLAKDKGGRRRGRDNHSSSQAAHTTYHGGLIDCCKVAALGYEVGRFVTISWRIHPGFGRHIKASGKSKELLHSSIFRDFISFHGTPVCTSYITELVFRRLFFERERQVRDLAKVAHVLHACFFMNPFLPSFLPYPLSGTVIFLHVSSLN